MNIAWLEIALPATFDTARANGIPTGKQVADFDWRNGQENRVHVQEETVCRSWGYQSVLGNLTSPHHPNNGKNQFGGEKGKWLYGVRNKTCDDTLPRRMEAFSKNRDYYNRRTNRE